MSQENVELVRRAMEAHRSGAAVEDLVAFWDPDCEYTSVMAAVEPDTYRGHDGVRRYLRDIAARWAEWRTEPEDVFELGADRVFASFRFFAVGKDSGAPVEARLGSVFVLRGGRLVQGRTYPSRDEALEAARLLE